eukprot:scaffold105803_cov52-Cyclotella_meneghiniana.AAC.1
MKLSSSLTLLVSMMGFNQVTAQTCEALNCLQVNDCRPPVPGCTDYHHCLDTKCTLICRDSPCGSKADCANNHGCASFFHCIDAKCQPLCEESDPPTCSTKEDCEASNCDSSFHCFDGKCMKLDSKASKGVKATKGPSAKSAKGSKRD